jgi:CubicO group peptidase (beta-lactamase class C family)
MSKQEMPRADRRRFMGALVACTAGIGWGRGLRARAGEAPPETSGPVAALRSELGPLIPEVQAQLGVPGLSLVLADRHHILWCEAFGVRDAKTGRPVTPNSRFRAGSLAKPLTAAAVLGLAETGRLDIDGSLNDLLPAFRIRTRGGAEDAPITPRAILCHHAGLPTDLAKGMWTDRPFSTVLDQLPEEYLAFPPGLVFAYSNVGYSLLGALIERASGQPFAEHLDRRILKPLGMERTRFVARPGADSDQALGHRDGVPIDPLPIRDLPACGLETTAADLGRLIQALLGGGQVDGRQVIGTASLETMFQPQSLSSHLDMGLYTGLGWFLEEGTLPGCGRVVRHSGSTIGFGAELILLPEEGLGAAVLANGDGSMGLCSRLAEEILTRMLERRPSVESAELFIDRLARPTAPSGPADLAGAYATDLGLIALDPRTGTLCACLTGTTAPLVDEGDGWFALDPAAEGLLPGAMAPLAQMRFQTRRLVGREVIVARAGEREMVLGEKVRRQAPSPAWQARIGHYVIENPDPGFPVESVELKLRDEDLCLRYRMPALSPAIVQVPLGPLSDGEAVILGLGRTRGETLRFIDSTEGERLRYSGLIGRRIDSPEGAG